MKLSRKQLNVIIENYFLNEAVSKNEIQRIFDRVIDKVQSEIKSKNVARLETVVIESVSKELERTNLYIVPINDPINDNPETRGYEGYALHIKFDANGKPKGEQLNANIIKDTDLQKRYVENPIITPIVVIFEKNIKSKKELERLIFHEVGHIKNNFIKMYEGITLNVEEVRNVLRKDLKNLSVKEMIKTFKDEGRLGKVLPPGIHKLVERLKEYYDGTFSEPADELSVDEFAVRISGLQRELVAQAGISKGNKIDFNILKKEYGVDIAGLSLFLKDNFTQEEVDAIVQNIEDENKGNTNV